MAKTVIEIIKESFVDIKKYALNKVLMLSFIFASTISVWTLVIEKIFNLKAFSSNAGLLISMLTTLFISTIQTEKMYAIKNNEKSQKKYKDYLRAFFKILLYTILGMLIIIGIIFVGFLDAVLFEGIYKAITHTMQTKILSITEIIVLSIIVLAVFTALLFVMTKMIFIPYLIILTDEKKPLRKSFELSNGNFWNIQKIFLIYLILLIPVIIYSIINLKMYEKDKMFYYVLIAPYFFVSNVIESSINITFFKEVYKESKTVIEKK